VYILAKARKPRTANKKGDKTTETLESAEEIKVDATSELISSEDEKPAVADTETAASDPVVADDPEPTSDPAPDDTHTETAENAKMAEESSDVAPTEEKFSQTDAESETEDTASDENAKPDADGAGAEDEKSDHTDDETRDASDAEDTAETGTDPKADDEKAPGDDSIDDAAEENAEPVEPVEEKKPEPVAATQAQSEASKGSIWPGFFGGVIAAMIGFIVGRGDALDQYLPESLQRAGVDMSAVETLQAEAVALADRANALAAVTETQSARIDALEAVSASSVLETVQALEGDIETLTAEVSALASQPPTVIESSDGLSDEALAELQSALEAQNAQIAALSERAAAAEDRAAGEAARILAQAALMRVQTAVDSGETFEPALTELEEVTPVEVPGALRDAASDGVPTLAFLQESYPDAARSGLSAARAEVPESEVVGLTGFLQRQFNVRSVTPREGDDPDAVLSRAQAAVNAGDLGTALAEMETLPEAARAAMDDWLQAASARKAAQDAASDLADSLNSN
jgi:hypothetical protein